MNYCSQCGASAEKGAGFCSGCGASLSSSASKSTGFGKGVAAAIVGITLLVGILWAAMGSNSADRRRGKPVASASQLEDAGAGEETGAMESSENVVIEEPGFVGNLLGAKPRMFLTISEGESLELQLGELISTETASAGDRFTAVLAKPVLVEGREALPRGSAVSGHVSHAERSDKVKGRATLALEFDSLTIPSGEKYLLDAEPVRFEARSTKKDDAVKIGGAGGVGALIGGIVGGKKGAAIGAGVGAGAGTGAVLATRGEEVVLAEGARLDTALVSEITVEVFEDDGS